MLINYIKLYIVFYLFEGDFGIEIGFEEYRKNI